MGTDGVCASRARFGNKNAKKKKQPEIGETRTLLLGDAGGVAAANDESWDMAADQAEPAAAVDDCIIAEAAGDDGTVDVYADVGMHCCQWHKRLT